MAQNKLEIDVLLNDREALSKLKTSLSGLESTSKRSVDSMNLSWAGFASKLYVAKQAIDLARTALDATLGAAIRFESAFAGVRKTVDATEEEFTKLRKNLLLMSRSIPESVNNLAAIEEIAGQLGVRGVDNLTKFTDTVAKISVTTNLTKENAALSFAQIANIMEEPIANIDRMGSAVVDLGNNSATMESNILNFAQRVAGAGRIANLSTADIFGLGAAFSSVGVEAEAGGTAVQKVLLELKERGFEGRQAFLDFVRLLQSEGDNAITVLQQMGLEDQRLIRAFLSLAKSGDLLEESLNRSSAAFEANTALAAEAEKRFQTSEAKTQLLKNVTGELAILLGEKLRPAYNSVVDGMTAYIQKVVDAEERTGEFTRKLRLWLEGPLGMAARALGTLSGGGDLNAALDAALLKNQGPQQAAQDTLNSQNAIAGSGQGDTSVLQESKNQEVSIVQEAENRKTQAVKENAETQKKVEADLLKFKEQLKLGETKTEIARRKAEMAAEKEKANMQVQINSAASQLVNQIAIASGSSTLKAVAIIVDAVVKAINIMLLATNPLLAILQIAVTAVSAANALASLKQAEAALKASQGDIQAVTNVPKFAEGVQGFSGGLAIVGEKGPELVRLPGGSDVIPNNAIGNGNVEVHFHGPVNVRNDDDIKKIALEVSTILDSERSRL